MENATKALIIAGAVLIAILLISVGIMVFNAANDPINQAANSSEQQAVQMFNESFTSYLGTSVSGQQVRSLVSAIIASNSKNTQQVTINNAEATEYKLGNVSTKNRYSAIEDIGENGYITNVTITKLP